MDDVDLLRHPLQAKARIGFIPEHYRRADVLVHERRCIAQHHTHEGDVEMITATEVESLAGPGGKQGFSAASQPHVACQIPELRSTSQPLQLCHAAIELVVTHRGEFQTGLSQRLHRRLMVEQRADQWRTAEQVA